MPAGRPPQPTAIKKLKGVQKDRINEHEPQPDQALDLSAPKGLPIDSRQLWDRLAPDMARKRVLTSWDLEALEHYCRLNHQAAVAWADLEKNGNVIVKPVKELRDGTVIYSTMKNPNWQVYRDAVATAHTLGTSLGLNPAARSKISTQPEKPKEKGALRVLS